MTLHDFLVANAKFPFPDTNDSRTGGTTDISLLDVSLLDKQWRAGHAVRDDTLVQKLCRVLKTILGGTPLAARDASHLLSCFTPKLQVDEDGFEDPMWTVNPNEAHVRFHLLKRESKSHLLTYRVGRC
jgi:hypothetical protein